MAQTLPVPPPGFDELPVEDKVQYVEALWDRIAAAPQEVSVPGWHRQILRDRLAEYSNDPKAGRPWRDVRDELLRDLAGRKRTSGA
jgi:putative addiction module component (TIGR02574 family)